MIDPLGQHIHESYHVETDYYFEADGNRMVVLTPNPDCPYCREEDRRTNRLEWAAQIWCRPENSTREMDTAFCQSIADALGEREGPGPC